MRRVGRGLAPATVRSQTRAIYQKLGIDYRASLCAALSKPHYAA
jgi:DNA-binding NarL/FixJ family response regulator